MKQSNVYVKNNPTTRINSVRLAEKQDLVSVVKSLILKRFGCLLRRPRSVL